ncbi:hypothetical protein D3C85_322420 [compost metagenome]
MLDTVTFVLHSINEKTINLAPNVLNGKEYANDFNRILYERLLEYESVYVERTRDFLNKKEIINPDDTYFISETVKRVGWVHRRGAIIETKDKGEMFFRPVRGNLSTPSSEYRTKFSVSENYDAITFELSIPKYLYNHNVAQFVPNIDSKRYRDNVFLSREMYHQVNNIQQRLIEFIRTFFTDLAEPLKLPTLLYFDMRHVEVKRLDLCYNQIFPSHEMVLDYLSSQRKFYKTRLRKDTIVQDDRDTSFYYRHSTDGFFFKIYSKGDEFEFSDLPRLFKENEQFFDDNREGLLPEMKKVFEKHFKEAYQKHNGRVEDLIFAYYKTYIKNPEYVKFCEEIEDFLLIKLSFLYREASKILRYEMSFTRKYMSTLYKRDLFRHKCPKWKKAMKSYNLIKRYDLLLSQGNLNRAKEFKRNHMLTENDRDLYELIDKSLHKKHQFFLTTDSKLEKHENEFHDYEATFLKKRYKCIEQDNATLNKSMFKLLFKKFTDEIDFFQVKEFKEVKTVLERIDDYNRKAEIKILNYKKNFGNESFKKMTHTDKRRRGYAKLSKTRLKIVLDKIEEGEDVKTISENLGMSKTSYYQLLKDLELFDLHKQTVKTKFSYSMITTCFKPYYDKFSMDRNYHRKFFINPFMVSFDTVRSFEFN